MLLPPKKSPVDELLMIAFHSAVQAPYISNSTETVTLQIDMNARIKVP
jgi:hypothetical protein